MADSAAGRDEKRIATVNQATARRRRRLGFVLLFAAVAGVAILWSAPWAAKPKPVAIETVSAGPTTRVLAVNGRIAARRTVAVRTPVAGQIAEVLVFEGATAAAGAPLARLKDDAPRALAGQAEAALAAAEAQAAKARADVARAKALGSAAPKKTLEDALAALAVADAETRRFAAALDQAKSQWALYTLVAPFDGVTLSRAVEPGQFVDTQTTLITFADLADPLVETEIDELFSAAVAPGARVAVRPTGEATTLAGRVVFLSPEVDPSTGGRLARIVFDSPVALPPGLSVTANIVVEEAVSALTAPRAALVGAGATRTALVDVGGVAVLRTVAVKDWPAERLIVVEGLAAGDRLIVDPAGVMAGDAVEEAGGE